MAKKDKNKKTVVRDSESGRFIPNEKGGRTKVTESYSDWDKLKPPQNGSKKSGDKSGK